MPRKASEAYKTERAVFATRLREIMQEKGENQTTLAEKLTADYFQVTRQTISLYMNGQSKPDTERLTAISKVLNVSTDWLLGLTHERTINGDLAQAARYTGLSANSIRKLHELSNSSYQHTKALLWVIEWIMQNRADDFVTWAWRAAVSSCCPKVKIREPEFAEIRHSADMQLLEAASAEASGATKIVGVPIADYETICTSTAVGIIRDSADEALQDFKSKFSAAFQIEKSKK